MMKEKTSNDAGSGTQEAAQRFARAIGESPQYRAYEVACEGVRQDAAALALLTEYREAQQTLRMMQSWDSGGEDHTYHVQSLKEKVFSHPGLRRFFNSQEALLQMVQEVNLRLREKLGFDFAVLARPAGGCC